MIDRLEDETLLAMEDGTAVPLPSFVRENKEAREIFYRALNKSKELHQSLDQLSDEERRAFVEAFDRELDVFSSSDAGEPLYNLGSTLAVTSVFAGLTLSSVDSLKATIGLGISVLLMLASFIPDIKEYGERQTLKELIRKVALE